jgi:thiol-disulfide isomerase/thioredoxin
MPSLAIPERFLRPYYLFNAALLLSYVALRVKVLDPGELGMVDPFGFTREGQIYFSLALMLFVRTLSAATIDAYIASAFMFSRVAVLVLLWFMADTRVVLLYLTLWVLIYILYPQPLFKHPKSILVLNSATFDQRVTKSKVKTINVVWFHTTWSARCTQLAPVLAGLADKYHHVRLRFSKIDCSRWPAVAERHGISLAATSQQLPTVVCFRQGLEVARIPSLEDLETSPNKWRRGFIAAHVAQALQLDARRVEADEWEVDARRRFQRELEARKAK